MTGQSGAARLGGPGKGMTEMYREEIERYIDSHRGEMLEDIKSLCRINSEKMPYQEGMPYGEGACQALGTALAMAERYGFSICNYDNYVGTADWGGEESQLDILAHLDVVPAGEGWTVTEPFDPVEKDGRLYGRGTADDKGPAVAALYAMRAVKELGIPLKKRVRLILGTDEECGSSDIQHYYAVEKEAPMTFSPDGSFPVVNIEKGHLDGEFEAVFEASQELPRVKSIQAGTKSNVVPGKAYAVFEGIDDDTVRAAAEETERETGVSFEIVGKDGCLEITACGAGAHASTPQEGKNAITALILLITKLPFADCRQLEVIKALHQLFPHGDTEGRALGVAMSDELSGALTLAFDILEVTEEKMHGIFDSRTPLCANEENVLKPVAAKMEELGITMLTDEMRPPHHVDGNSDFVRTLLSAYEEYTGRKGECVSMGGGTYVHDLKNGVAFGAALPETDNRMHGADEFAVIDELLLSAKIFAQVIAELCA